MNVCSTIGALLIIVFAWTSLCAEESIVAVDSSVPNVRVLSANWWGFVNDRPAGERAGALQGVVQSLRSAGTSPEKPLEIETLAKAYVFLTERSTPAVTTPRSLR
ncbi:MAG: hypothetical protein ACI915_002749 [Gammaproteobacteria bacterium]|jgi:hypothetical protein